MFSGAPSQNLGGEICTPQIWGVWVFRGTPKRDPRGGLGKEKKGPQGRLRPQRAGNYHSFPWEVLKAPVQRGPLNFTRILLVSPHPLNLGGARSPPKFLGVECPKPLVLQCFLNPYPLNLGVKLRPPKFRGYGLTGLLEFSDCHQNFTRNFLEVHSNFTRISLEFC